MDKKVSILFYSPQQKAYIHEQALAFIPQGQYFHLCDIILVSPSSHVNVTITDKIPYKWI